MNWEATEAASHRFTYLESVDSTNTWLMNQATVHPREVALTMNQTAGRGRLKRAWVNRAGEGIAVSVVVPGDSSAQTTHQVSSWIPLLVGAAVVSSVRSCGVEGASIKWPNDVVVDGRKLAGILCEVRPDGFVIAGVGINVSFSGEPPDARAISLAELIPDARSTLDTLIATVIHGLSELMESDYPRQRDSVISVMDTIGRDVEVIDRDGSRRRGFAEGLDETGALLVRMADGSTNAVASSDIEHLYE
jgi:BirA family transcriptional regulator, biotin operon repressor / biotin---[acetyl-CoA-carboxylase] ligase